MRTFFRLAVMTAIVAFTACKSMKTTDTDERGTGDGRLVEDAPAQDTQNDDSTPDHMDIKTEDLNAMLYKMNDFSLNFYKTLSSEKTAENISFSPASLNMAMAIVYSGARAQTLDEMSKVFGFEPGLDEFHPLYHAYFSELVDISGDTLVDFNLANRVFLETTYPVLPEYAHAVQKWHGGAFEKMDFRSNPRQAESAINTWVEQQTRNRIQDLIPPGSITDLTRLILVNALYIKSDWKHPFDKNQSKEKIFTLASGQEARKEFMIQRKSNIPWYEEDDFIAIELPYTSPELSLIVIRPNEEIVNDISQYVPDANTYQKILNELRNEEVIMEIPSFKIESEFALVDPLKEAGMEEAFDDRADFSGISGDKDLQISSVLQKVFFEMDEEGSEAAAATAVIVVTTSAPAHPPEVQLKRFIANRPFLFILKENRFNTPLFIGQLVE